MPLRPLAGCGLNPSPNKKNFGHFKLTSPCGVWVKSAKLSISEPSSSTGTVHPTNSVIKYSMLSAKMKVLFRKLPVRPGANPLSAWAKAAGASPPSHAKKHPGTDCSVPGCPAYLPVSSQPDPLPETPQPGPWYQPRRRCSGSPARLRCARSSAHCPGPGR